MNLMNERTDNRASTHKQCRRFEKFCWKGCFAYKNYGGASNCTVIERGLRRNKND